MNTGAGTLHNYETTSGLRFALYTTKMTAAQNALIRQALKHIYTELWIECVVRSPLYVSSSQGDMKIACTNFESKLDTYLASMPWFK
jgi:Sybindin-like family